jgi:hypothetical protein
MRNVKSWMRHSVLVVVIHCARGSTGLRCVFNVKYIIS